MISGRDRSSKPAVPPSAEYRQEFHQVRGESAPLRFPPHALTMNPEAITTTTNQSLTRSSTTSTLCSPSAILDRQVVEMKKETTGSAMAEKERSTDTAIGADGMSEKGTVEPIFVDWDGPE